MSKFFGTDGIRQKAEDFTPRFLKTVAHGLVEYAHKCGMSEVRVLVGGDTRESGEWIIRELEEALETLGVEHGNVGVLPTPAINYVFYEMGFDFAIDVTASHNPYTDNGIKIFERGATSGQKLSEEGREIIEKYIEAGEDFETVAMELGEDLHDEAVERYMEHLVSYLGEADLTGLMVGMDCADGATSAIGAQVFEKYGAKVSVIHNDARYGQGINNNCGSTHLDSLRELVASEKLDFGVAFDGDGDRVLMIDEKGEVVDGDQIIAILCENLRLPAAAVTVMANQGLFDWAERQGVKLEVTAVGDQNVAEAMRANGIKIGGEQSGHVILPGEATGDGMLTALMVAKVLGGRKLSELAAVMERLPQVIVNMSAEAAQKVALKESAAARAILLEYNKLAEAAGGRMLVRPSGTENLIRVTMWGRDETEINRLANDLTNKLKEVL